MYFFKKNIFTKKAYLLIGFFIFYQIANSQNQKLADSLIAVYNSNNNANEDVYNLLINVVKNETHPHVAIEFANELIRLSTLDSNFRIATRGYIQKGHALRVQGNLEEAIAVYFISAELAKSINFLSGIGDAYLSIGDTYDLMGDNVNSIKYLSKSITILRDTSDSLSLAGALMNTGYGYYLINQYDSALIYYNESAEIYEIKNFKLGIAYNHGNGGLVYAKQGKTELAEQQLTQAIKLLMDLEDSYAITEFQIEMASIYRQKKNYQTAEKYLLEAMAYAQEDGLQERVRDASHELSELYEETADYKNSHYYLKQYLVYRDSINNEDVIRKMADLRTEFEVGQKQSEVDFLNKQSESRQFILFGVVLFFILVCILAYVMYVLYKLRGRAIIIAGQRRKLMTSQRNTLEELNNTKDKFFSIISHDIRGPVNNFHGVAYLIKMHVENGETEELAQVGEMLESSTVELSSLLDNLLEWAMSQQGKFPYKLDIFNVVELCNSNLSMMKNMAEAKEIGITQRIDGEVMISSDRNSTSTIIRNLLSNAIKFTKKGGSISLIVGIDGAMATIEIKDTGVGMSDEKMSSLFGFKGERSEWGTSGEKGVGLGLNLVHEFVEMNKGKIEVKSEPEVGTSFIVYLPLASSY